MANQNQEDNWERFIQSCLEDDKIKNCKTSEEINNVILSELKRAYQGKAPMWKIKAIAEDAAESVSLRMNIA